VSSRFNVRHRLTSELNGSKHGDDEVEHAAIGRDKNDRIVDGCQRVGRCRGSCSGMDGRRRIACARAKASGNERDQPLTNARFNFPSAALQHNAAGCGVIEQHGIWEHAGSREQDSIEDNDVKSGC
jgi:hypothetical protein